MFSANAVSTNALTFVAITPCRLVDTRGAAAGFNGIAPFSGPPIASKATLTIPVQSPTEATDNTTPAPCGAIPSIAQAYSFNLTVVPLAGGAVDYVSMWPAGSTQPVVATLDDPQGAIVSNAAIVPAGPIAGYGGVSVYNDGPATANVVIDMNGYFAAPTDVNSNTAIGAYTLTGNTTGTGNTATGYGALEDNTTGSVNTANGAASLENNTTGSSNTANGVFALLDNTTGASNTAIGTGALQTNTSGNDNTAGGYEALHSSTTAGGNTANGYQALMATTIGQDNAALGFQALVSNVNGSDNTASGEGALYYNTSGAYNTATGAIALQNNTTGTDNIAIGYAAAFNAPIGNSNSIYIYSEGSAADSSGTIRIGAESTQTSAYIAGIYGQTPNTNNVLVCIDSNGKLGTASCNNTPSSRRFKEQISDMGDSSSKLFQLRPVTFLYKPEYDDGSHALQFGLIAEEVAKVYPDMVGYDKEGQPASVKYQALAPMLLNELQKQNAQLQDQNVQLQTQVQLQQEENRKLEDRLAAVEALLSPQ